MEMDCGNGLKEVEEEEVEEKPDIERRKKIIKGFAGLAGGIAGLALLKTTAADWIIKVSGKEHRIGANTILDGDLRVLGKVEIANIATHIAKDGSENMVFTDAVSGARTLAQLLGYTNQIQMWNGLIANIPDGWIICDGANGTPDMRDKFVRGAGAGDEAGGTGGSETHLHAVTGNSAATAIAHVHKLNEAFTGAPTATVQVQSGTGVFVGSSSHLHCIYPFGSTVNTASTDPCHLHAISFNSAACSTLPSYHELIFIMRS